MIPECGAAEHAMLGAMMVNGDAMDYGLLNLREEDFFRDVNRAVFRAMRRVRKGDIALVWAKANKKQVKYEDLMEMVLNVPNAGAYNQYTREILETSNKRKALRLSNRIRDLIEEGADFSSVRDGISELSATFSPNGVLQEGTCKASLEEMRRLRLAGADMPWFSPKLHEILGGLRKQRIYAWVARTSHGKTTSLGNQVLATLEGGGKVVWNIFENLDQVYPLLACIKYDIPRRWVTAPYELDDDKWAKVEQAMRDIHEYCDGRLFLMYGEHVGKMVDYASKADLMIVDYIQAYSNKYARGADAYTQLGEAAHMLRDAAVENDVAIIVAAQAGLKGKDTLKTRPRLSDVFGSAQVGQAVDVGVCLYWKYQDFKGAENEKELAAIDPNRLTLYVDKNRSGECGIIHLHFDPITGKMRDRG